MSIYIKDRDEENREFFVPFRNERISVKYEAEEDVWKIVAVEIPPEAKTFRIGPRLLEFTIETARYEKRKILPACPYAESFLASNPRYEALLPK